MPHIKVDPTLPGIRSLFAFRPETAKPLSELAHLLLHAESSLTRLLRIAAAVGKGGKHVTEGEIEAARAAGATDLEEYRGRASQVAKDGYLRILKDVQLPIPDFF